jgi:hypothetical protein
VKISLNLSSIKANSFSVDKSSVNLLIHVTYIFWEQHVAPIQLIVIGINHLIVVLQLPILLF